LLLMTTGVAWFLFQDKYWFAGLLFFVVLMIGFRWLNRERRLLKHMNEFAEAVHFRDFTRRYPVRNKVNSPENTLFRAFNAINQVFFGINSEKEMQHQYLSKVINMLDMALIFYQTDTG